MKQYFLFSFVISMVVAPLFSFDWPVDSSTAKLRSDIAENRNYQFNSGLYLSSSERAVSPFAPGIVVFKKSETDFINRLPSVFGNLVVVEHKHHLQSVYGNLELLPNANLVEDRSQMAKMGMTGFAQGDQLYFEIYDLLQHNVINPYLLLPLLEDTEDPIMKSSYLEQDGRRLELKRNLVVSPGKWMVLLDGYDIAPLDGRGTIYRFELIHNDISVNSFKLEGFFAFNGELVLTGDNLLTAVDMYSINGEYVLGEVELESGRNVVELHVWDYAGNESYRIYSIEVQ